MKKRNYFYPKIGHTHTKKYKSMKITPSQIRGANGDRHYTDICICIVEAAYNLFPSSGIMIR